MPRKSALVIELLCIIGIITFMFSCNDVEEGGKEGWDYDTIVLDSSCSMYIEYPKGKYFLNISTIDSCINLNNFGYLKGYEELLEKYSHKLFEKKGIATFQTPFNLSKDTMFTNNLINITNTFFKAYSSIVKKENFVFVIDVQPTK